MNQINCYVNNSFLISSYGYIRDRWMDRKTDRQDTWSGLYDARILITISWTLTSMLASMTLGSVQNDSMKSILIPCCFVRNSWIIFLRARFELVASYTYNTQTAKVPLVQYFLPLAVLVPRLNRRSPFRSVVHFPDCIFRLQPRPWSDIIHPHFTLFWVVRFSYSQARFFFQSFALASDDVTEISQLPAFSHLLVNFCGHRPAPRPTN